VVKPSRLKEIRESNLVTQEELSLRAGVGVATISRIEGGHTEPHFRTIRKLAKALGVKPQELMGDE
jgi:transcriptional regulator with XRE-family HTH domain